MATIEVALEMQNEVDLTDYPPLEEVREIVA